MVFEKFICPATNSFSCETPMRILGFSSNVGGNHKSDNIGGGLKEEIKRMVKVSLDDLGKVSGSELKRKNGESNSHSELKVSKNKTFKKANVENAGSDTKSEDVLCFSGNSTSERRNLPKESLAVKAKTWVSYGGRILEILQSLDSCESIDEALEPWEGSLSAKERTIILKEQTSWERAVKIFQWFKQEAYQLNVIHYNILLRILGKAQQWSWVKVFWNEMIKEKITPTNVTYCSLIHACGKACLVKEALAWLGCMISQGLWPDEAIVCTILNILKKAGRFEMSDEFYKGWSCGDLSLETSFESTIFEGILKPVNSASPKLQSKSTSPLYQTSNNKHGSLVHGPSTSQAFLNSASDMFVRVKGQFDQSVLYTYNALIDAYGQGGRLKEAYAIFGNMIKEGINPDTVTLNILVGICGSQGNLDEADDLIPRMKKLNCMPNTRTFNILISFCTNSNKFNRASSYFDMMLKKGVIPDTVTFNTLLHVCRCQGNLEEADTLIAKMQELKILPDAWTYNTLIALRASSGSIEKTTYYFDEMKKAGLVPNAASYNALLLTFCSRHLVYEAESLVQEMVGSGISLDRHSQAAFIKIYISMGLLHKAWASFQSFHLSGNMDPGCYSVIIDAYGRRGYWLEAEKVFSCILEKRQNQSILEYNVMLKAYGIATKYDKAFNLFEKMEARGIVPDSYTYCTLVQLSASAGMLENTLYFIAKIEQMGFLSTAIAYCAVIVAYGKLGKQKEAESMYQLMVSKGIKPDVVVFGALINMFVKIGCMAQAKHYFQLMEIAGISGNIQVYNSLIKGYMKCDLPQEAGAALEKMKEMAIEPDAFILKSVMELYTKTSELS